MKSGELFVRRDRDDEGVLRVLEGDRRCRQPGLQGISG
jgi:hypothetical protein